METTIVAILVVSSAALAVGIGSIVLGWRSGRWARGAAIASAQTSHRVALEWAVLARKESRDRAIATARRGAGGWARNVLQREMGDQYDTWLDQLYVEVTQ